MPIRNPKQTLILLVILLFSLGSCKKHSSGSSILDLGPNVFVVGSVNRQAVYWNNGGVHYLVDTTISQWSYAGHIVFSGNDMYLSGSQEIYSTNLLTPVYWKNGVMYNLPGKPQGEATNLAVSGSDLYVSGDIYSNLLEYAHAVYWKNQVIDSLPGDTSSIAQIITSGTDIYAAGQQTIDGIIYATFWKNGMPTQLVTNSSSGAAAIGFLGNDLYVAGTIYSGTKDTAVYWKNGVQNIISPSGSINGMCISNGDVYLAGSIIVDTFNTAGICWKNGNILTQLPGASMVYDICVSGTDVYLVGVQGQPGTGTYHAVVWKNGVAIDLGANNFAYSVTVK